MNRILKSSRRLSIISMTLLSMAAIVSCDNEWPDDICECHRGGNTVGGWEEGNDTTNVNKKDSVGIFEISVDKWGDICTQDICL